MNEEVESCKLIPLVGKSLDELKLVAKEIGLPAFQGGQICKWLYEKRVTSFDEMTHISKTCREKLELRYRIGRKEASTVTTSTDSTIKYLFQTNLDSAKAVESVYIPEDDRAT